ncbi:unnamed protein product [Schistosoma margrebowiei]|uniref:Uncharacterized protein n=1 Tax=Schistosoma margrebowiei TaxID=48269 RepID=A0A183LTL5_9TREM|nr:unnamed protein product [Schistosoma margrebowiei]
MQASLVVLTLFHAAFHHEWIRHIRFQFGSFPSYDEDVISRLCLEEEQIALGDVQIQHQDLIRHHEQRRQELMDKHKETQRTDKTTAYGGR